MELCKISISSAGSPSESIQGRNLRMKNQENGKLPHPSTVFCSARAKITSKERSRGKKEVRRLRLKQVTYLFDITGSMLYKRERIENAKGNAGYGDIDRRKR
jgi:hypothetical protein